MAGKKRKSTTIPRKTYWHLYSLQELESAKLIEVVNKVLKKEYQLVK